MLLQRIITASILAPLVIFIIFGLQPEWFSLIWGVIILFAAWEWTNLAGMQRLWVKLLYLLGLLGIMVFIHLWTDFLELLAEIFNYPEIRKKSGVIEWTALPPVLFWVTVMMVLHRAADSMLELDLKVKYKALIGWLVLGAGWMFLSRLRTLYGTELTMYFLLLIWAADITAYFVGKKYGKTKFSPTISPGKTVAGVYGAMASSFLCVLGLAIYFKVAYSELPWLVLMQFIVLSALTVQLSIYGDLYISLLKRQRGIKDSGNLLPGHGGILDRVDSIIASIPFFYGGVYLIYVLIY